MSGGPGSPGAGKALSKGVARVGGGDQGPSEGGAEIGQAGVDVGSGEEAGKEIGHAIHDEINAAPKAVAPVDYGEGVAPLQAVNVGKAGAEVVAVDGENGNSRLSHRCR